MLALLRPGYLNAPPESSKTFRPWDLSKGGASRGSLSGKLTLQCSVRLDGFHRSLQVVLLSNPVDQ